MNKIIRINHESAFNQPEDEKNFIIHSNLNAFHSNTKTTDSYLSIKTVFKGTERYTVNGKRYDLNPDEFLVVDRMTDIGISFDANYFTEGMCFYIDENLVHQNILAEENGEAWLMDNYGVTDKRALKLFSSKFRTNESDFGLNLKRIANALRLDQNPALTEDLYLELAMLLTCQQKSVLEKINSLSSLKYATREELYARVATARTYIEDNLYSNDLGIKKLARVCSLSEAQLHRTFKQVYQVTPYQYILSAKLKRAVDLFETTKLTLQEISFSLGFADLPTFSKAFKRKYRMSPKAFQKAAFNRSFNVG